MKEENVKSEYQRKVDKSLIPTCNIMGVNIAAINMNWLLKYIDENLSDIKGDYICVSNVHTTVTSYEDAAYCAVQNGGLMAIPDGGPLSSVGRKRGYSDMDRTTGPSLMGEIFKISAEKGYRHYFYGSTEETLKLLEEKLQENYPGIQIAGMYGWKKNNFIRNMFATWWRTFKNSSTFRRIFLLAFYTAMILLRTVLNREIWFDPLGKIFGGWGLYEEGQFTTESIENFMLFVPFSVLLLWAFQKELLDESENIRFGKTVWKATKVVAVFSFMIEFTQLLYNTSFWKV